MNARKVSWGLFLIIIGIILVLRNMGVLHFYISWRDLWKWWPAILIFLGVSSLLKNTSLRKYDWLMPVLIIIVLVYFLYSGINRIKDESVVSSETRKEINKQHFYQEIDKTITRAKLNFEGGGAKFILVDTTAYLIDAYTATRIGEYTLEKIQNDSVEVLNFKMSKGDVKIYDDKLDNTIDIRMNTFPVWDIDLSLGAGTGVFDFSKFKVSNLTIASGAAEIDLKIADNYPKTTVRIESGASSLKIRIPKSAQCLLNIDAVLSSKNIEGFVKKDDDTWESGNYTGTGNIMTIEVDAGVSEIDIQRY